MSLTAAPATSEIMSAVPLTKAGVGSAVNDTTRELGGALGIAIFGSIVNSAYRAGIDLSGIGLPSGARAPGRGLHRRRGGDRPNAVRSGGVVTSGRRAAFTDAFNLASAVSIGVALVAAAAVLILSRPRRHVTVGGRLGSSRARFRHGSRRGARGQNEVGCRKRGVVDTSQDPRIERSRRVILEAVLEELGAVGYGALTIEAGRGAGRASARARSTAIGRASSRWSRTRSGR